MLSLKYSLHKCISLPNSCHHQLYWILLLHLHLHIIKNQNQQPCKYPHWCMKFLKEWIFQCCWIQYSKSYLHLLILLLLCNNFSLPSLQEVHKLLQFPYKSTSPLKSTNTHQYTNQGLCHRLHTRYYHLEMHQKLSRKYLKEKYYSEGIGSRKCSRHQKI